MAAENAEHLIEIRVDRLAQLFHTLDPFPFREKDLDQDAELFRVGRRSLAIGIPILVACFILARLAAGYLSANPVQRLVEESLLILGWVANWRPLEIFLYDWWPLARRRDLYRRLAAAAVELRPYAAQESQGTQRDRKGR